MNIPNRPDLTAIGDFLLEAKIPPVRGMRMIHVLTGAATTVEIGGGDPYRAWIPDAFDRATYLLLVDALACRVRDSGEGGRVGIGLAASVVDTDFAVYVGGPAFILGHGPVDLAMHLHALRDSVATRGA